MNDDLIFNEFMHKLRYINTFGEYQEFIKYNLEPNVYKNSDQRNAVLFQRMISLLTVEDAKEYFDFSLDFSQESLIYVDLMIDAITDLEIVPVYNTPYSQIKKSFRNGNLYSNQAKKYIEAHCTKANNDEYKDWDIEDKMLGTYYGIIQRISAYIGETYIKNYGGEWDNTFIITNKDREICFYNPIKDRFYKNADITTFVYWMLFIFDGYSK